MIFFRKFHNIDLLDFWENNREISISRGIGVLKQFWKLTPGDVITRHAGTLVTSSREEVKKVSKNQ